MTTSQDTRPGTGVVVRTRGGGYLVAALLLLGPVLAGCSSDETPTEPVAPSSSTASPSAAATPDVPSPDAATPTATAGGAGGSAATDEPGAVVTTGEPPAVPTTPVATRTAPPVDVGEEGRFDGGLVATVERVSAVDLEARGPGEVEGPGRAVVLGLENGSDEPVDLAGVAVSATYADGTPAPPSSSAPSQALTGTLRPGRSAEGTYVFAVPEGESLRIEVQQNQQGDVVVVQS